MRVEYLGNKALLEQEMTAFLAPGQVSPVAVLPTLDWATEMARTGRAVVSGFSSRLEKEVFAVLARGASPIVKVMVQSRYKQVPTALRPLLDSNRLLIISLGLANRLSRQTAQRRNAFVVEMADEVVFPAAISPTSSLYSLYANQRLGAKPIHLLT